MTQKPDWAAVAVGAGILLLAIVVGWQAAAVPVNAIYARVGPTVFPWLVTGMLAVLGCCLTVAGWTGGWPHEDEQEFDLASLAWLGLGLLLNVVLIDGVSAGDLTIIPKFGFILASTALFVCTARAFASRQPARDAAIGFVLAVTAYIGFDRVLGYKIGSGLIESLI